MEDADQRLRQAISLIIGAGYQLDAKTLAFLKDLAQHTEIEGAVKKTLEALATLPEQPLFLTKESLEAGMTKTFEKSNTDTATVIEGARQTFRPYAKEVAEKIEVLDDPTERISSEGNIEDYVNYFKNRFTKINKILRERTDAKDAIPISEALKLPLKSKVKIIGIVTEKRERRRSVFIQIEDYESSLTVLVPLSGDRNLVEKTRRLIIDQVACVEATKFKEDVFIAKDLISPDIPERKTKSSAEEVYAVFTSDVHVGSKQFLETAFNRFTGWLRGSEGNDHQREIASRVKYVIIAGDIVDGIGVYPNHEKELAISDIYEQYEIASKLLKEIPEYIEIVIIPGNHDATRQALPQPAILRKYAKSIYDLENVTMLGDPARVRLHGVDLLLYHGRSLDDIIGAVPDVTYLNLAKEITIAMEYILKTRHLAPIYGSKTPIAPMPVDALVVESPPDILHVGHVHVMGYEAYRGTLLINSGAWQGQTQYQEKMGLMPTPGIVPVVDLKSLKVMPINFLQHQQ